MVTAAPTPGQLAYEAGPLGWVGRGIWPPVPWEKLTPQDHAWWDKVARANDPWPDWALLADARREAEKLRAENAQLREAIAAQEPHAAPGLAAQLRDLAKHWEREYVSDQNWPQQCAYELVRLLDKASTAEPQPAPGLGTAWRLLGENRALLAEILGFLSDGIPPGDEFALQVAQWRERGLPS